MQWIGQLIDVVAALVVIIPLAGLYIWWQARIVRTGSLGREWGTRDEDEAREEMERLFPGSTREPTPERPPRTTNRRRMRSHGRRARGGHREG